MISEQIRSGQRRGLGKLFNLPVPCLCPLRFVDLSGLLLHPQSGHHNCLDRVHPVFRLVKHF